MCLNYPQKRYKKLIGLYQLVKGKKNTDTYIKTTIMQINTCEITQAKKSKSNSTKKHYI